MKIYLNDSIYKKKNPRVIILIFNAAMAISFHFKELLITDN